jgi:Lon protease-like protein
MPCRTLAAVFAFAALLCSATGVRAQSPPLPDVIPIFPLEIPMLFPGMSRPLHIFEPRYRAMVADALKGDRIIGMTTLKPGYEADYAGRPPIYEIGCAGIIEEFQELPGGRFNIVLRGLVKFRVDSEDQSRPYRLARVAAIPEVLSEAEKTALRTERERLQALIESGGTSKVPPETSDEALVNMVAQHLPLGDPAERQGLLEMSNPLLRSRALIHAIETMPARPR